MQNTNHEGVITLIWAEYKLFKNAKNTLKKMEFLKKNVLPPHTLFKYSYPDFTLAVCFFKDYSQAENFKHTTQKIMGEDFNAFHWKTLPAKEENIIKKTLSEDWPIF